MIREIKSRLLGGILLAIIAVFLIIFGAILTIRIVFSIIEIPLLILGVILLLISILTMFLGTFSDLILFLKKPFGRKEKDGKGENVIELKKKGGVYRRD